MAALTASCIDLNIQGNGAYSVLKQLATIALQNGFITDSHQFLQTLLLREKCTLLDLVPVSPCRTVKAPALNNRSYYSPAKRRLLTGKPAMAKTSIAGSASACRKAAKRIRSKSSAHCVAKLFTRNLFINCNRAIPTGACLVKSNPQLIRKWRWSHPYVLSRSPTAPPGSLTPTWWRKPGTESPFSRSYHKSGNSRVQWR